MAFDAGLSERMAKSLDDLISQASVGAPPKGYDYSTSIDLSNAHNEVLRSELVEFFKTTIDTRLTEKAFDRSTTNGGDLTLRNALASFLNSYFHPIHPVKTEHIVLTAGATDAIESLIHTVCDDGDSVIVPGPCWHGYEAVLKARANVNIIMAAPPTYQNWDNYLLPSIQAVYDFSADKSRIKAVILCNPHNPLARCYTKKSLVECMEFCQERGLHLISDEILALTSLNISPDKSPPFVSALSLTEPLVPEGAVKVDPSRVHVVWSASKLFGSGGFRVGCVISQQNPQLLAAIAFLSGNATNTIGSLYLSSLLSWSQLPTLLALNSERLTESYHLLANALQQWGIDFIRPTEGICLYAKLAKHARSTEEEASFYDRLALHGVRLGPGRLYKGVETDHGWSRIRFSVPASTMNAALERISSFLAEEE